MARNATAPAYSLEDGSLAVRAARAVVDAAVSGAPKPAPVDWPEAFRRNAGVFTTLTTYPHGELRGCVGFAEPVMPLSQAILASAAAAALEDRRFAPVEPLELDLLLVELSLLTPPFELRAKVREQLPGEVEVGRHGLIVRTGKRGGLLLPQVAADHDWQATTFLEHTCIKAGLEPGAWRQEGVRVLAFEAEIFAEHKPRGPVERHDRQAQGPGRGG